MDTKYAIGDIIRDTDYASKNHYFLILEILPQTTYKHARYYLMDLKTGKRFEESHKVYDYSHHVKRV